MACLGSPSPACLRQASKWTNSLPVPGTMAPARPSAQGSTNPPTARSPPSEHQHSCLPFAESVHTSPGDGQQGTRLQCEYAAHRPLPAQLVSDVDLLLFAPSPRRLPERLGLGKAPGSLWASCPHGDSAVPSRWIGYLRQGSKYPSLLTAVPGDLKGPKGKKDLAPFFETHTSGPALPQIREPVQRERCRALAKGFATPPAASLVQLDGRLKTERTCRLTEHRPQADDRSPHPSQ
ncbi:hypothetical protein B0T16DRAFT_412353 [Cercophora newfieldiana]|uniref:Uncharacterized protein n=1 Tax=Cercophora newfieldiana TaxID=92897 RepID=A0AA40CQL3_9PEZI|nr:hypothetical protein B0T16DRAFT_412353 [Cercophora newfieldiana]